MSSSFYKIVTRCPLPHPSHVHVHTRSFNQINFHPPDPLVHDTHAGRSGVTQRNCKPTVKVQQQLFHFFWRVQKQTKKKKKSTSDSTAGGLALLLGIEVVSVTLAAAIDKLLAPHGSGVVVELWESSTAQTHLRWKTATN